MVEFRAEPFGFISFVPRVCRLHLHVDPFFIYVHTLLCACIHTYRPAGNLAGRQAGSETDMHTCICMCTSMHAYTPTCMHAYSCTCMCRHMEGLQGGGLENVRGSRYGETWEFRIDR